jgi:hypothetical protein
MIFIGVVFLQDIHSFIGLFENIVAREITVINQHLFIPTGTRLVTCPFTYYHMTTHMILSLIYAYHRYLLSIFRWNPLGSPSPLTMTHSLLFLLIPHSFRLMPSLPYHMLILSYAHHWLIRYFSHSYAFRLDDSLSSYLMDAYLSSLVTVYLLCI